MDKTIFKEEEIPYDDLLYIGMTRQMFDDLPKAVIDTLLCGGDSPLLPIRLTADDGRALKASTRFSFIREKSGRVVVLYYPRMKRINAPFLEAGLRDRLAKGEVVVADVPNPDGVSERMYLKMEPQTLQIIGRPVGHVAPFIRAMEKNFALDSSEVHDLEDGNPVTIPYDNEFYTIGVDPQCPHPLRYVRGDTQDWESGNEPRKEPVRYEPGLDGCWIVAEDGSFDYVPEENYDDVIKGEIDKRRLASPSAPERSSGRGI